MGIYRRPVIRKNIPFDDVIMWKGVYMIYNNKGNFQKSIIMIQV